MLEDEFVRQREKKRGARPSQGLAKIILDAQKHETFRASGEDLGIFAAVVDRNDREQMEPTRI
jgi:hypothetical protein